MASLVLQASLAQGSQDLPDLLAILASAVELQAIPDLLALPGPLVSTVAPALRARQVQASQDLPVLQV